MNSSIFSVQSVYKLGFDSSNASVKNVNLPSRAMVNLSSSSQATEKPLKHIKIKIFDNYFTSDYYKKAYENCDLLFRHDEKMNFSILRPEKSKIIQLTNENDYTHAIIINLATPKLNIPKENVLGLALEPPGFLGMTPEFIEYAKKHIGTYYIGQLTPELSKYTLFKQHYAFLTFNLPSQATANYFSSTLCCDEKMNSPSQDTANYFSSTLCCDEKMNSPSQATEKPLNKTKIMSLIISQKQWTHGQRYRHHIASEILKTNLPIDIYGRGCFIHESPPSLDFLLFNPPVQCKKDSRLKGEFKEEEPYTDYKFHICIENFQVEDYFSEKIINPLIFNSIPIYLGCSKIAEYFPKGASLEPTPTEDINLPLQTTANLSSPSQATEKPSKFSTLRSDEKMKKDMILYLTGDIKKDMKLLTHICNNVEYYEQKIHKNIDYVKDKVSLYRELERIF